MLIGTNPGSGKDVQIEPKDLTTHAVVLGRTGSGKSGAVITLIEEAVLSGASAIIIDPKGDLTNLALTFPSFEPIDFEPWIGEGQDPWVVCEQMRDDLGKLSPNVQTWEDAADVTIYTPGKTRAGGVPINILPSMAPPCELPDDGWADERERATEIVLAVLQAIGRDVNERSDPAVVFLVEAIIASWNVCQDAPIDEWPDALTDPPEELNTIGGLELEEFFSAKERLKLARQLIAFNQLSDRWLRGAPLDMAELVPGEGEKPRVSIFTLRHLDEPDRQFFVTLLMAAISGWLRQAPACKRLKLLVVLDEARGYLPPAPYNPPTKKPICNLLAQGRAQGVGVVIGTQNPGDLDYKALSNVGTWLVGRLRERDLQRDLTAELEERHVDPKALLSVPERTFYLADRGGLIEPVRIRGTYSYLAGPLTDEQLALIHPTIKKSSKVKRLTQRRTIIGWLKELCS